MPVAASDIVVYGAANRQDTDSGTQGGAIATTCRYVFTDLASNGNVEAFSSSAGDTTQSLTVTGRLASGVIDTDVIALNGTTVVAGAKTFERVLKMVLSGAAAGTVTVRRAADDAAIATLEPGLLEIRRLFYNAAADAAGGAAREYFEKVFFKNTHATLALTAAQILEQADPSGKITFALDNAVDGTTTSTDRRTAPASGVGAFDNAAKSIPGGGNLAAGSAIGVWVKASLNAGDAATKTTWTGRCSGTTT